MNRPQIMGGGEGVQIFKEEADSPFPKCCPLRWPRHLLELGLKRSLVFVLLVSSAHLALHRQSDVFYVHIDIWVFCEFCGWGLRFWVLGWR